MSAERKLVIKLISSGKCIFNRLLNLHKYFSREKQLLLFDGYKKVRFIIVTLYIANFHWLLLSRSKPSQSKAMIWQYKSHLSFEAIVYSRRNVRSRNKSKKNNKWMGHVSWSESGFGFAAESLPYSSWRLNRSGISWRVLSTFNKSWDALMLLTTRWPYFWQSQMPRENERRGWTMEKKHVISIVTLNFMCIRVKIVKYRLVAFH